jgi:uncharacterized membrane protein
MNVYLKAAFILVCVDLIWLSTGGIFARAMTERIQGEAVSFRYIGAVVVYFAMAYLLLDTRSYKEAFYHGLATYAVYDFTNYALFEKYDWKFAIADSLWGGLLFMIARYLLKNVF